MGSFREQFGRDPVGSVRAPGRVNLIGEHTDYSGGLVLPLATKQHVRVWYGPGEEASGTFRVYSEETGEKRSFHPEAKEKHGGWLDYPRGVARVLIQNGLDLQPGCFYVSNTLDPGKGLGSSGAFEVAMARAMLAYSGCESISGQTIARYCHEAETSFVGVPCGIMDQYASACLDPGQALFLNCRSEDTARIPLPLDTCEVVVMDTGIRRDLSGTSYQERVSEFEEAVDTLKENGILFLGRESSTSLNVMLSILPSPLSQRIRHIVQENDRVRNGARHLSDGELAEFGQLMYESHESLDEYCEVSTPELNRMVHIARETEGVYGAKLTGAGFGGCVVCLAKPGTEQRLRHRVRETAYSGFDDPSVVRVTGETPVKKTEKSSSDV